MILLEFHNRILQNILIQKLSEDPAGKRSIVDSKFADFDGVIYHVHNNPDKREMLTVSVQWPACHYLLKEGAKDDIPRLYKGMSVAPEAGYDVSLSINCTEHASDKRLPMHVAMLKRNIFASPFKRMFATIDQGKKTSKIVNIPYKSNENVYLKAEGTDRCHVIFKVGFKDPADQVLGKLFLQEFADARKNLRGVPAVKFYMAGQEFPTPPVLEGVEGVDPVESGGYVSFVLFKNHIGKTTAARTINIIQTFRNYFHYHIKCAKAYMHNRMRWRVSNLLKVLNRAKTPAFAPPKKKTMSGRTFKRKV